VGRSAARSVTTASLIRSTRNVRDAGGGQRFKIATGGRDGHLEFAGHLGCGDPPAGLHQLGVVDRRYAPDAPTAGPAGAVMYWHVDDVPATLGKLLAMGAKEHQAPVDRGAGFITASVVDPFGNILGIVYNPHYLDVLGTAGPPTTAVAGYAAARGAWGACSA
jgi:hypothetical protein